jgi:hypothetical protein
VEAFERSGYDFVDFDRNSKNALPADGKTLRVTPENLPEIVRVFSDGLSPKGKSEIAFAMSSLPLIAVQEAVHTVMRDVAVANPEAYETLLLRLSNVRSDKNGMPDGHCQTYAFERLAESGYDPARLAEMDWGDASANWSVAMGYREFVVRHFGEKDEDPASRFAAFAKVASAKGAERLFADVGEYWKARKKQKRSVDPFVRKSPSWGIVERA